MSAGQQAPCRKPGGSCAYCGKPEDSLYWDGQKAVVSCRRCAGGRMMFSYLGRAGDPASQESVRRWGAEIATRASSARASPGG